MPENDPSAPAVVLVTGASRGLGRGIAEELARAGFSVGVHFARNRTAADETASACRRWLSLSAPTFVALEVRK